MSRIYELSRAQIIPASLEAVWAYFSDPGNLAEITPDYMRFHVTSPPHQGEIYPGQIITYKICPVLGIPLTWMTEITHVKQHRYFVDEQRVGPYSIWHHQHRFESVEGGVLMQDLVHYQMPLGFIGNIAHALFVKRQLEELFHYRTEKVKAVFGEM
ncbi:ligand-binding SRPBCC domain-containing protein [Chitinophaga dinghuensis]|uniref:Ligand-binding SRPBCC domain-containing protein n=1 Tax=Chitinophaga dinghuensis TaxID=1539050 RepID=A0A327W839_9BACT|nr:SRPBCC family protein [Chitinophaga dinghuensis]RAJ85628.1 ligand-binding SRPBCC domain-containing protein [Chitinophaga dinghuensis]